MMRQHEKYSKYRYCIVRECKNTSIKTPGKLFIQVPREINTRNTWLQLANRDPASLSAKGYIYFCEDHFDLENDMENYIRYKIMRSVKKIRMNPGCVPSRFDFQADRKRKRMAIPAELEDTSKKTAVTSPDTEQTSPVEMSTSIFHQEPSSNMLEACRTCLRLINIDNSPFYEIEAVDMQLSAESCRYKLLSIVPEMALNITPKSMLCAECHGSLQTLFEFKEKCLKTENIIAQYFQTKLDLDLKNFDLKDVSAFNTAVKEEVELSDTVIVKHEVDDFSLESVEIARPKNAVPGSFADIKISEDEAVEASVEDIAVKEEVELSDTVITNVKHEVDDFSSESVAQPKNAVTGSNFMCDKLFKNSSSLKRHMLTHTGEKPHHCKICNRRFRTKHRLTVHLLTHTGEQSYVCTVCGKGFPSMYQLTVHRRRHTGAKPYHCETCSHNFSNKWVLTNHLRIHTGERPYVCTVCGKGFSQNSQLPVHMRSHTGEKPHRCETCDRSFACKTNLTKHLRIHTGEQLYVCTVCGNNYSSGCYLKKHKCTLKKEQSHQSKKNSSLVIHHKKRSCRKNFQCKHCKELFYHKQQLQRHIMIVHKEVDVNTILIESKNSSFIDQKETQNSIDFLSGQSVAAGL